MSVGPYKGVELTDYLENKVGLPPVPINYIIIP
jgi:hypothetical protein